MTQTFDYLQYQASQSKISTWKVFRLPLTKVPAYTDVGSASIGIDIGAQSSELDLPLGGDFCRLLKHVILESMSFKFSFFDDEDDDNSRQDVKEDEEYDGVLPAKLIPVKPSHFDRIKVLFYCKSC